MLTNINLNTLEDQTSSGVYAKRNIQIIRGEGAYVWDTDGKRYLDCVSGQGASNLGHGHPEIIAAIQQQMMEITVCSEMFYQPTRALYQSAICEATGMTRVFLCTSGAEAVEAAIKFAHLLTGRSGFISTTNAYHGRTLGSLSATWDRKIREPFQSILPAMTYVPFNDLNALENILTDDIAAVIIEPIQGYGGVQVPDQDYLQKVQEICRENGTLLIVDEIQTGFGRTGSLFAYQEANLQPDILCLAKSIAGGLPMGAVLLDERLDKLPAGSHGSTFGGHPLGCAAGLAVLDILQNTDLIERSRQLGEAVMDYLRANLPSHIVQAVRGRGFMIGIELNQPVAPILNQLMQQGVLAMSAGAQVIRLLPPLVISEDDLWQVAHTIEDVLQAVALSQKFVGSPDAS